MKAFYVFVLTIGVCLANERTPPDSGHPSNSPVPRAPIVQVNTAAHHEKEDKTEVSVNHDDSAQHSSTAPKITTTNASTTVPTPSSTTIAPPVNIDIWNVTDDKGVVCILLKGDIALDLVDETNNKTIATFEVPKNVPNHGSCVKESIEFDLPNNSSLSLMFGKDTSKFFLRAIEAKLSYVVGNKTVPGDVFSNETLHLFENPLDQSYFCSPSSENLVVQKPLLHLTLKVKSFQVQAYKNSTSKNFDTAVNCENSSTPDIVPIIVGCALAVLVILVLVAYLISRRRSQSRGYFSM